MTEHIFITLFSCSERHNLHRILTKLVHHISYKIKSLLICQTGNNTDHHCFVVFFQTQLLLKRCLIFNLFFSESIYAVIFSYVLICLRIIILIINTIYNTGKTIRSCIHKAFQLLTVKCGLNFLCVSITYRCDSVRIHNSAF